MVRFSAELAAQEMWELWGMDAEQIAKDTAAAHVKRGETQEAKEWNAIAQAVRFYIGPTPHPLRPYGKLRPRPNPVRHFAPKDGPKD